MIVRWSGKTLHAGILQGNRSLSGQVSAEGKDGVKPNAKQDEIIRPIGSQTRKWRMKTPGIPVNAIYGYYQGADVLTETVTDNDTPQKIQW